MSKTLENFSQNHIIRWKNFQAVHQPTQAEKSQGFFLQYQLIGTSLRAEKGYFTNEIVCQLHFQTDGPKHNLGISNLQIVCVCKFLFGIAF